LWIQLQVLFHAYVHKTHLKKTYMHKPSWTT
jgi:hypothetical protein